MVVCLQKCHQQLLPSLWHMPLFHQVMESICPLLQLGWLHDLLWTTECSGNYAAILGPRPLEAWQVLLSSFRDLASMISGRTSEWREATWTEKGSARMQLLQPPRWSMRHMSEAVLDIWAPGWMSNSSWYLVEQQNCLGEPSQFTETWEIINQCCVK